jgi:hypothetical protein
MVQRVAIRCVNEDVQIVEGLLELAPMKGQTGADEVFFFFLNL